MYNFGVTMTLNMHVHGLELALEHVYPRTCVKSTMLVINTILERKQLNLFKLYIAKINIPYYNTSSPWWKRKEYVKAKHKLSYTILVPRVERPKRSFSFVALIEAPLNVLYVSR